eukprot:scaffold2287_cov151-Cylindrotheca_fusiformis.AAC.1
MVFCRQSTVRPEHELQWGGGVPGADSSSKETKNLFFDEDIVIVCIGLGRLFDDGNSLILHRISQPTIEILEPIFGGFVPFCWTEHMIATNRPNCNKG